MTRVCRATRWYNSGNISCKTCIDYESVHLPSLKWNATAERLLGGDFPEVRFIVSRQKMWQYVLPFGPKVRTHDFCKVVTILCLGTLWIYICSHAVVSLRLLGLAAFSHTPPVFGKKAFSVDFRELINLMCSLIDTASELFPAMAPGPTLTMRDGQPPGQWHIVFRHHSFV
jgi:hypothetical protein